MEDIQNATHTVHDRSFLDNTLSDLYMACQEGDYPLALVLLETSEFKDINRRESNGSTALHVAAALGHADIVTLLLHNYGVMRNQKDLNNCTAYEVACNDEIRQLFHRPKNNNRFYSNDDSSKNLFDTQIVDEKSLSDRVERHATTSDVRYKQGEEVRKQVPDLGQMFQNIFKRFFRYPVESNDKLWASNLLTILEEQLGESHTQYSQACQLIQCYLKTSRIEPLLCLYTLETPFYRYLTSGKDQSNCLAQPLLDRINALDDRVFKGDCFRGLSMTSNELEPYNWAFKHKNGYLEMNTFCSTSEDITVAEFYTKASETKDKIQVLMKFSFLKTCCTAIRLYKISNSLSCLSNFENEREILILPGTFFSVTRIETDEFITRIYLEHFNIEDDIKMYRYALQDQTLPDY